MQDLTTEQWIEMYPYLKEMSKYTLFTSAEDVKKIRNGEKINVDEIEISIEFLKKILNDNNYYEYAHNFFTNETNKFIVSHIIAGDIGASIDYKKTQIIKGLEQLITSKTLVLQPDQQKKYETLKNAISSEQFIDKNKGTEYSIEIEGKKYSIPIEQLVYIMELPEETFDTLCDNDEIKFINKIPKEHFIFAIYKYFETNKIFDEYIMPKTISDRYDDIKSSKKIDIQALNKHLHTTDTKFKKVKIDENLDNEIKNGMPENASELEQAIYIYIKMCKLLTYDEEYYAVDQKGEATKKHEDINYVSGITPTNNQVVCFEFNLIYSKYLNDLGIKFSSDYESMLGEAYGAGHVNLEFRSGKYLVSADSVTSILQGDIMRAKLNQPLVGLRCINNNEKTKQEFKKIASEMYNLVAQQEKQKNENAQTFNELMNEYINVTTNIKNVDLNEKLSILIDKVNSTKMVGIDSLSYVLQIEKILFDEDERKNNIGITIIRNNEPFDQNKVAMPTAIITLNKKSFEEPENNIYYYYNPNDELMRISKEELQSKFDDKTFEYVANDDPKIPGIIESGEIKK